MRRWVFAGVLALALVGCRRTTPVLMPGDTVRPQIAFAPKGPWEADVRPALGMLLEVHRPGRDDPAFLQDKDVPAEQAKMQARLTFWKGDAPAGEPLIVPFVRDC